MNINSKGNRLRVFLLGAAVLLPAAAQAQFTFTTNNGAITITSYTGSDSAVVIPDATNGLPVTSIGNSAFYDLSSVTNVTIPNSVTNIDVQAFTGCGLVSMVIPDSVLSVGQSAFLNCTSLMNLTIGSNVLSVGDDAFFNCSSLINVFIPKSVTNLYSTALNECSSLTAITVDAQNPAYSSLGGVLFDKNQTDLIVYPGGMGASYAVPAGVTSIGDFAFTLCQNLINITLPEGITNIGQYAFYSCSGLTNITLPGELINIGQYAFSGCGGLTNLALPGNVTTIGLYAFAECFGLTNILIPASVTNIAGGAFSGLPAITVATNNPAYSSVGGVLFDSSQTTIVEFPSGRIRSPFIFAGYNIPNSVTHIGDLAFGGCGFLTNISIPPGLTSIGQEAFDGCGRLTNLAIPDNVTNIGNSAFASTGLASITIPASVTTLGWLGDCPSLKNVYFQGNAPGRSNGVPPLAFLPDATAYYLPNTTGWSEYFQNVIPTALWLPQMQTGSASIGGQTNQFGFNINWASGQTVVVEACTNLANPSWQPVQTNLLTTGSAWFSDPQWTNYPRRFYHLRSQ